MRPFFSLTEAEPPWVIFAPQGDELLARQLLALQEQGGAIHRISARDIMEPRDLFRVFACELGFPDYFGHNWDALVDCLSDPHVLGHGNEGMVVIVESADILLDADQLGIFVSVLGQAADRANLQLDSDGIPTGISVTTVHFVFALESRRADSFAARVADGEQRVEYVAPYLFVTLQG